MRFFLNIFLGILLCLPFSGSAQDIDLDNLKALSARSIGPAGMSGRVTSIDVDHSNQNRIVVGTASGGVWYSESGGVDWRPIFDDQDILSIGAVAINQSNPAEIWVGTGEGNPRNSHNSGKGIYKSIDGGKNWQFMGLEATKIIHRIYVDPQNPSTVYVAALGSAWGPNKERGLYKTTNGGETWDHILAINDRTGIADLVIDPKNPKKLLAASWEFKRTPWDFYSGGKGSGLHLSYDGGKTWKKLTSEDGLPKGDLGRIGLAFAPSKPNIVYALVEAKENGLYKSTDGGLKWKLVSTKNIGGRPFYYSDIFVDPQNENRIYNLYTVASRSEDGGKTFEVIAPYNSVHPDHHAFWISPTDPDYLIDGNDGGLNISRDGAKTWRFVENLPLAQFYHIRVDNESPYNIYGGMQDNGSWVGPSKVFKAGGIRNSDWQEVMFGDGFDVMPKKGDPTYLYAMSQGGNLGFVNTKTGERRMIKPQPPEGKKLRFNWNAALEQDPFNDCGVYYGSQYVHYSPDCGNSWKIISPDLTTNDTTKQKQHLSGGLTIDATAAENHTTILSIAPSPSDKDVIFVGTDDGHLQVTKDGGQNWTEISSRLPGVPKGAWYPYIEYSPHNSNEIFVIVNNYRKNDWKPYAYHSTDGGNTWRSIIDKNVDGHTMSIVQDPVEEKLLFLGTDRGLYFSLNKGRHWQKWTNGFPPVSTRDLAIQEAESDLVMGTFGRAAYVLDDIGFLRDIARSNQQVLKEKLHVSAPNQPAYITTSSSFKGARFAGNAIFKGQNESSYPRLTVWKAVSKKDKMADKTKMKKSKKGKKAKKKDKKDKADDAMKSKKEDKPKYTKTTMLVLDSKGDTVRYRKIRLKEGLNRVYWYLERNGERFPGRELPKKDAMPSGGMSVLPGKYTIIINDKGLKDTAVMEVKIHPKSGLKESDLRMREDMIKDYSDLLKKATAANDRLLKTKKLLSTMSKLQDLMPDSTFTKVKKQGGDLSKEIAKISKKIMMPRGLKGIQMSSGTLGSQLGTTSWMLGSNRGKPTQNIMTAFNKTKRDVNEVVKLVDAFYLSDKWKAYKKLLGDIDLDFFKQLD